MLTDDAASPTTREDIMSTDAATFRDDEGRRWLVRILWGHPTPAELGIRAAAFQPEGGGEDDILLGYVEEGWLEEPDQDSLRLALRDAEPGRPA
jgi:hypothetical protein